MYLDKSKKIDFPIPLTLENVLKQIDEYYYAKDDLSFALWLDDVEAVTKQCLINGNITAQQLNLIFERYGLR